MATVPTPDPASTPDDEIQSVTANPWWSPLTSRLLAELDPEPQPDDAPAPAEEIGRPAP